MNKTDLVKRIADETGLGAQTVELVVGKLFKVVTDELVDGGDVALAGFGNFSVKQRAARTGRNPQTGEPLQIAASRAAGFKPAKGLRDALNT